jgi:hypothetical protein
LERITEKDQAKKRIASALERLFPEDDRTDCQKTLINDFDALAQLERLQVKDLNHLAIVIEHLGAVVREAENSN